MPSFYVTWKSPSGGTLGSGTIAAPSPAEAIALVQEKHPTQFIYTEEVSVRRFTGNTPGERLRDNLTLLKNDPAVRNFDLSLLDILDELIRLLPTQ